MATTATLKRTPNHQIAEELAILLADTYLLYVKTQNFHWNVKDSNFHSLHKFFEDQYEALADAVDEIAERIRSIGEKAPGSMRDFLKLTRLEESPEYLTSEEMLKALLLDHESIILWLKSEIEFASKHQDPGTADLCTVRLRAHEKTAWMLKASTPSR